MKPRTKLQHEIFNLSKIVLDVADKVKKWAHEECNDHIGFATKKHFWCINCGDEHPIELVKDDKVTCPTCSNKLSIRKSLKRTFKQSYDVAFAEILGEYQIIRIFDITTSHKKFQKAEVMISENIQQFIPSDHSKIQYVARTCNMGGYELRYGDLEIRKPNLWNERKYDPLPFSFYPESFFKAEYSRIGIDQNLQGLSFLSACTWLSYSQAETLLKAKQYSLFNYFGYQSSGKVFHRWASIKIAIRNNYTVDDAGIWLDYLDLLERFNKDLRSPKYLFPKDLNKAHDKLVDKKKAIDRKQEIIERKKRIKKEQEVLEKKIKDFKDLQFSKGDLVVKVILSIQEFIDEGEELEHCVYSNYYYNKKDSLVFSSTYKGARVETTEISLSRFEVIQSRGLGNEASEHNKSIIKLVENNMYQIQERLFKIQKTA